MIGVLGFCIIIGLVWIAQSIGSPQQLNPNNNHELGTLMSDVEQGELELIVQSEDESSMYDSDYSISADSLKPRDDTTDSIIFESDRRKEIEEWNTINFETSTMKEIEECQKVRFRRKK